MERDETEGRKKFVVLMSEPFHNFIYSLKFSLVKGWGEGKGREEAGKVYPTMFARSTLIGKLREDDERVTILEKFIFRIALGCSKICLDLHRAHLSNSPFNPITLH
jgi:hypothetical protein